MNSWLKVHDTMSMEEYLGNIPDMYTYFPETKKKDKASSSSSSSTSSSSSNTSSQMRIENDLIEELLQYQANRSDIVKTRQRIRHERGVKPFAQMLPSVADWASWLQPICGKIDGFTDYHQFKFKLNDSKENPAVILHCRHLAEYPKAQRSTTQWPFKIPILSKNEVDAKRESGAFHANPVTLPANPLHFNGLRATVQAFLNANKMTPSHAAQWEKFFNKWDPEKLRDQACAVCIMHREKITSTRAQIPRAPNPQMETESDREARRRVERQLESLVSDFREHIRTDTHAATDTWWTQSPLIHFSNEREKEQDNELELGNIVVNGKAYLDGTLQAPVNAPRVDGQRDPTAPSGPRRPKQKIQVNDIVFIQSDSSDDKYCYYVGQVGDVHKDTGTVDVYFWERHFVANDSEWWPKDKDGKELSQADRVKEMRKWHWQEMHRCKIENHWKNIPNTAVIWWQKPSRGSIKAPNVKKAMEKDPPAEFIQLRKQYMAEVIELEAKLHLLKFQCLSKPSDEPNEQIKGLEDDINYRRGNFIDFKLDLSKVHLLSGKVLKSVEEVLSHRLNA